MNPNVNFMCTLDDAYSPGSRQRSTSQNRNGNARQQRGRSPFRPNQQSHNSVSIYFNIIKIIIFM